MLLRQARSRLDLGNGSGFRDAIGYSIGALASFADALRKESPSLCKSSDRPYSDKRWLILDQLFADRLRGEPNSLAKVRRLLDSVAEYTQPPDKPSVTRMDAVVVVEATESILNLGAEMIRLDGTQDAS